MHVRDFSAFVFCRCIASNIVIYARFFSFPHTKICTLAHLFISGFVHVAFSIFGESQMRCNQRAFPSRAVNTENAHTINMNNNTGEELKRTRKLMCIIREREREKYRWRWDLRFGSVEKFIPSIRCARHSAVTAPKIPVALVFVNVQQGICYVSSSIESDD